MALKDVQKNILKKQESMLLKAGAEQSIEQSARKHYRMANVLARNKNYSTAYFMYHLSLKEYATLYVRKKLDVELPPEEALKFLGKRKKFSLSEDLLETINNKHEQTLSRVELERKDCEEIRRLTMTLRREL